MRIRWGHKNSFVMSSINGAITLVFLSTFVFFSVFTHNMSKDSRAVRPPGSSESRIGAFLERTNENSIRFDTIFYKKIRSDAQGPDISESLGNEHSYCVDQLTTFQISPADVYKKALLNLEEARLSNDISAIEKAKSEVIEVVRSERRMYLHSVIITYSNDFDDVDTADVQLKLKEFDDRLTDLKIPLTGDLWIDHTPGLNSTCLSPYPTTEALLKMYHKALFYRIRKCMKEENYVSVRKNAIVLEGFQIVALQFLMYVFLFIIFGLIPLESMLEEESKFLTE